MDLLERGQMEAFLVLNRRVGERLVPVERAPHWKLVRTAVRRPNGTLAVATARIEPRDQNSASWRAITSVQPTLAELEAGHPILVTDDPIVRPIRDWLRRIWARLLRS